MDYFIISSSSFSLRLIFTVLALHAGLLAAQRADDLWNSWNSSRQRGGLVVLPNHMKPARNRQDVMSGVKFSFPSMVTKGYSLGPPLPFRRRTSPVTRYNVPSSSDRTPPPFRLLASPQRTLPGVAAPVPLPYPDSPSKPPDPPPDKARRPSVPASEPSYAPPPTYTDSNPLKSPGGNKLAAPSYEPPEADARSRYAFPETRPPVETTAAENSAESRYAFPDKMSSANPIPTYVDEQARYAFPDKIGTETTTVTSDASPYAFPDKVSSNRTTPAPEDTGETTRYVFPDKISSDQTTVTPEDTGEATRYVFPDKISQTTRRPDSGEVTRYAFPDKASSDRTTVPPEDTGEVTRYVFPDKINQTTRRPDSGEATRYAFPDKASSERTSVPPEDTGEVTRYAFPDENSQTTPAPDSGEATRYAFPDQSSSVRTTRPPGTPKTETAQPTVPNPSEIPAEPSSPGPYETPASAVPTQPNAYETPQIPSSTPALQSSTTSNRVLETSTVPESPPNPYETPSIPESSSPPSPHETTFSPPITSSQPPSPSETTKSATQPPLSPSSSERTPTVPSETPVTPTSRVTPHVSTPSVSSSTAETGSPATQEASPSGSTPGFGSTKPAITTSPPLSQSESTSPSHVSTEITPSSSVQSTPSALTSSPPFTPESIETTATPPLSTPGSNRPTSEIPTGQPPGSTQPASISTVSLSPTGSSAPTRPISSPPTPPPSPSASPTTPRSETETPSSAIPTPFESRTVTPGEQPSVSSTRPPTEGVETTAVPRTTEQGRTTPSVPPNRIRGKPHVICEEDGIVFNAKTFFPFVGEVFARDRKDNPMCHKSFDGGDQQLSFTIPYKECGRLNPGARPEESEYSVEVVVSYRNEDGTSTIQSFLARCVNQRIRYETENIPRRIEEALEELNLIPIKVEQKAVVPDCLMRIVPEPEEHHGYGPSESETVEDATIGQQLRIEWSLQPPSDAYGFHVRNCTVRDKMSGQEYLVIDENGCSTDINILAHPHYDTYHDLAIVHWHAFKVPDNALLSIRCSFIICSDIADENGVSNCDDIPTPPFCPDLITAPVNSLLFDLERNAVVKRSVDKMRVRADICVSDKDTPASDYCLTDAYLADKRTHMQRVSQEASATEDGRVCVSRLVFSALTALSALMLALALGVYASVSLMRRRRRCRSERIERLPSTAGCYVR